MGTTTLASTFSVSGGLAAEYIKQGALIPWSGVLAVEGGDTGDRRSIAVGALSHRDLPLPFMLQLTNPVAGDGHDGASLSGNITELSRQDDGRWWGEGFIDPTMMDGDKLAMALDRELMRGVSIDLDQVETIDVATDKGNRQVITKGRIIGATACPFAAFAESEIHFNLDEMQSLAASAGDTEGTRAQVWMTVDPFETLIASAGSAIPVDPPLEWLTPIRFSELTPFTVLGNGRVFGHIAAKGTCHISFSGKCVPVPRSRTNYAAFRVASTLTAEGDMVRTGPLVMDTVHPDLRWKASDAMAFYSDTGCAMADLVPYDDQFGLAVVGAMRPGTTPAQMRALRGSDFSPDWRTINGNPRECCAILAVNNSGFKLPQTLVASAGMCVEPGDTAVALDTDGEIYALVASGPMSTEPCCAECAAHEHALVAAGPDEAELAARIAALRDRFVPSMRSFTLAGRGEFAVMEPVLDPETGKPKLDADGKPVMRARRRRDRPADPPPGERQVRQFNRACRTEAYTQHMANHPSARRQFRVAAALTASGTSEGARKAHIAMGHVPGGKKYAKAASKAKAEGTPAAVAAGKAGAKADQQAKDAAVHADSIAESNAYDQASRNSEEIVAKAHGWKPNPAHNARQRKADREQHMKGVETAMVDAVKAKGERAAAVAASDAYDKVQGKNDAIQAANAAAITKARPSTAGLTPDARSAADQIAAAYQARPKGTKATFDKASADLRKLGVKNPISYLAEHAASKKKR